MCVWAHIWVIIPCLQCHLVWETERNLIGWMSIGACSIGTSLKNKADILSHMVTAWRLWASSCDNTLCCDCSSRHLIPIPWVRGDVKEYCGWTEAGMTMDWWRVWAWERKREKGVEGVCIALCAKMIFHSSVSSPDTTHFIAHLGKRTFCLLLGWEDVVYGLIFCRLVYFIGGKLDILIWK